MSDKSAEKVIKKFPLGYKWEVQKNMAEDVASPIGCYFFCSDGPCQLIHHSHKDVLSIRSSCLGYSESMEEILLILWDIYAENKDGKDWDLINSDRIWDGKYVPKIRDSNVATGIADPLAMFANIFCNRVECNMVECGECTLQIYKRHSTEADPMHTAILDVFSWFVHGYRNELCREHIVNAGIRRGCTVMLLSAETEKVLGVDDAHVARCNYDS
jgi:hypothetical protein